MGQDELEEERDGAVEPDANLSLPVQFSKEKYILDSSPEKLHKELEEELKLSSTDLRSHAWYHGRIPREVSRTQAGVSALDPSAHVLANPNPGSSHQTVSPACSLARLRFSLIIYCVALRESPCLSRFQHPHL